MIEKQMELDGTFCPSEVSPVEQRKRQADDARVQTDQLVLEPELLAGSPSGNRRLALAEQLLEHGLVERPWPVSVSLGQRGALRRVWNAQVLELPLAAGQAAADLAQAVRTPELTEEHRDELAPAGETLGCIVRTMFLGGLLELEAREELQQLREDATKSGNGWTSLEDRLFAKNQSNLEEPWKLPLRQFIEHL